MLKERDGSEVSIFRHCPRLLLQMPPTIATMPRQQRWLFSGQSHTVSDQSNAMQKMQKHGAKYRCQMRARKVGPSSPSPSEYSFHHVHKSIDLISPFCPEAERSFEGLIRPDELHCTGCSAQCQQNIGDLYPDYQQMHWDLWSQDMRVVETQAHHISVTVPNECWKRSYCGDHQR